MTNLLLNSDQEISNDNSEKPFVGRYHQILRNKNTTKKQQQEKPKKLYKEKIIKKKKLNYYYFHASIEGPIVSAHIHNFYDILAINEHSIRNPLNDESFILSKFYTKKVKYVSIQGNFMFLNLEGNNIECTPIGYICERLKSFGDCKFLEIAENLLQLEEIMPEMERRVLKCKEFDDASLQDFLGEMENKMFMSQYSQNLLVISKKLIEFLGFNFQEFALQSIKYKSILHEFFTAEHYGEVLNRYFRNNLLINQYLRGLIDFQMFHEKSSIVYRDVVYSRSNVKNYCQIYAGASKQLKPYLQIRQLHNAFDKPENIYNRQSQSTIIKNVKENHHIKQFNTLKKITNVPKHLDPTFKKLICGYDSINRSKDNRPQ